MPVLKFLQKITKEKEVDTSNSYSRTFLSRNRRLPACYQSNDDDDEGQGKVDIDEEEE